MLTIRARRQQLCDGLTRRDFLRIGTVAGFGLSLPGLLWARGRQAAGPLPHFGRAKR